MQAQESQIGQWKNSYLHNIIQFCVDWRTVFFKVELIFNNASLDRLERHTEKSSNLFKSKIVLKVLFQKFSRNIYARTTPAFCKLKVTFRLRGRPSGKYSYANSFSKILAYYSSEESLITADYDKNII